MTTAALMRELPEALKLGDGKVMIRP